VSSVAVGEAGTPVDGRVTDESEFDWVTVDVLFTSESVKVMDVDALITPEAVIGMEVPPVVVPLLPVSVPIEVGIYETTPRDDFYCRKSTEHEDRDCK
jgi:hypothetical protein